MEPAPPLLAPLTRACHDPVFSCSPPTLALGVAVALSFFSLGGCRPPVLSAQDSDSGLRNCDAADLDADADGQDEIDGDCDDCDPRVRLGPEALDGVDQPCAGTGGVDHARADDFDGTVVLSETATGYGTSLASDGTVLAVGSPAGNRVDLYPLDVAGPATAADFSPGGTSCQIGAALAFGTVTGDEFHDLLIGGPLCGDGAGEVTLITASHYADPNDGALRVDGAGAGLFGASVSVADRLVAVGAPLEGLGGSFFVVEGSVLAAGGLNISDFVPYPSATAAAGLGGALGTGAWSGTGAKDLAVGAPGDGTIAGEVWLYNDLDALLGGAATPNQALTGGPRFGMTLTSGALSDQGTDSLIVAEYAGDPEAAEVTLHVFHPEQLDGAATAEAATCRIEGLAAGAWVAQSGGTVLFAGAQLGIGVGDASGDGAADLLLGSPGSGDAWLLLHESLASCAGVVDLPTVAAARLEGEGIGTGAVIGDAIGGSPADLVLGDPREAQVLVIPSQY